MIYWFTGQPGSGKTVLSVLLKDYLEKNYLKNVIHIDGDDLREIFENKDYSKEGRIKNIVFAQQLAQFCQTKGFDVVVWLENTVTEIRKYTDRPIIVRAHPGDKNAINYLNSKDPRWTISSAEKITDDFINAWAVITYNSSPAVAAAIEGIPVFVTDPVPQTSQAFEIANTDLSLIESPNLIERQQWIEKISMSHWNFQQLKSGQAWQHIRKYV